MGYILSGGDSYALSYIYLRAANSPNCVCKQQPILALFFYLNPYKYLRDLLPEKITQRNILK